MYDEIDLRPYFQVIAKKWLWILLMSILLGLAGLLFGLVQPEIYEATVLLAVNRAVPDVSLDGRIQESANGRDTIRIFPELATSDELLQSFIDQAEFLPAGWHTVAKLRSHINAEAGTTSSLIVVTVSGEEPEDAMLVANAYGVFFAEWLNETYGDNNSAQNVFFVEQLDMAAEQLNTTLIMWQQFEAENDITAVRNRFDTISQTHRIYLETVDRLNLLQLDIKAFQTQIADKTLAQQLNTIEETTLLALQLRTYQAQSLPITFNLDINNAESNIKVNEAQALLEGLIEAVNGNLVQLDVKILEFEQELLSLQEQNRELTTQQTKLQTDYDVALELYTALSYRVDEQFLTEQEANDSIFVLSRASLPHQGVGFGVPIYLLIGLLLGGFLSFSGLIVYTWWQVQVSS